MSVKPYVKPPRLIKERGLSKKLRQGRGFSICEIEKSGLDLEKARGLSIPIDVRRRSCHEWNIKILKELLSKILESKV